MTSDMVPAPIGPYDPGWDDLSFDEKYKVMSRRRDTNLRTPNGVTRLEVDFRYETDFTVDLPALIMANLDIYWSDEIMTQHSCTREWERPEALLWDLLTTEGPDIWGQQHNASTIRDTGWGTPELTIKWGEADWLEMIAKWPQLDPEKRHLYEQVPGQMEMTS